MSDDGRHLLRGRIMRRVFCHLLGCRWMPVVQLPEEDPRWDRMLWRCERCGDRRKVWAGYKGTGRPDRVYESVRALVDDGPGSPQWPKECEEFGCHEQESDQL